MAKRRGKSKRADGARQSSSTERRPAPTGGIASSPWFWPAVIFIVGMLLRIVYVMQVRHTPFFESLGLDAKYYDAWAHAIAGGRAESEAFFMSPLYPYFLSAVYRLFGRDFMLVRVLQGVMGSLTAVLTYLIGSIVFGKRTGVVAGFVVAAYGALIFYDGSLVMSPLLVLLNTLAVYLLLRADENRREWRYLAAGAVLGLAAVGRASALVFVPVAMLWVYFAVARERRADGRVHAGGAVPGTGGTRSAGLRRVAALAVGVIIVVAPVTVRNYVVSDDFVMITSNGGLNFYIGNSEISTGGYVKPDGLDTENDVAGESLVEAATGRNDLGPSEISAYWYERAREYIAAEPGEWVGLLVKKLSFTMSSYELPQIENYYFQKRYSGLLRLPLPGFALVAPLGLVGLAVSLRRRRSLLLSLFVATYVASIVAFFVVARYRLPVIPMLALGAVFMLEEVWRRAARSDWRFVALTVAAAVCVGFVVNANLYGIDRAKSFAQPHFRLGVIYTERGDYEKAAAEYRVAMAIDPDYVRSYLNLGALMSEQGMDAEAEEMFRALLERDRGHAAARVNLAMLMERAGHYAAALAQTDTVLAEQPHDAAALRERGVILYRMGESELADETLAEALRWDEDGSEGAEVRFYRSLIAGGERPELSASAAARIARADSLLQNGRVTEGVEELELAIAEAPLSTEPLTRMAVIKRNMGLMDEAVSAMRRAVELEPALPGGHFNLGILLSDAGDHEGAIHEYESELRINPTFAPAHLNLALTYRFHSGNANRAEYHYRTYRDQGGAPVEALESLLDRR